MTISGMQEPEEQPARKCADCTEWRRCPGCQTCGEESPWGWCMQELEYTLYDDGCE